MKSYRSLCGVVLSLLAASALTACSKSAPESESKIASVQAHLNPDGNSAVDQYGNTLQIQKSGNKLYVQAEGTFSPSAFANLSQAGELGVKSELNDVIKQLKAKGAIPLMTNGKVGYFSFLIPFEEDLLGSVKAIPFKHEVFVNPVVYDTEGLNASRAQTPAAEGLTAANNSFASTAAPSDSGSNSLKGYSGIERIGAPEFVTQVESLLGDGTKVDGSSVKLGISDTGITLNHPAFISRSTKKNRITYLKDFTREGRVFFAPNAKFAAKITDASDEVELSGEVILTPKLPAIPPGDLLFSIPSLKIKASPELKAALVKAGDKARLGILLEDSFQAEAEPTDINANGKKDDKFVMILIPGATPEESVVYVDVTGKGDLSKALPLGDWNATHATVSAYAETFGFNIQSDQLPKKDGSGAVDLISASIVGFDAGNHGSHVAGIAAGSTKLVRGVAPEASILLNRVCANNGGCNATQAIIDLATNGGAEVINMSLGGLNNYNDGYGVQETIVNRITAFTNTLVVISAGNSGPGRQTVGSPSVARLSLSVGAAASKTLIQKQYQWAGSGGSEGQNPEEDFMLFFSSRGPTAAGGFKPNISAPGTELSSVQLNSAQGARGGLDVYWGTSMAAPTATGGYALFLDGIKKFNAKFPDKALSTDARVLREVLIETARPFDMNSFDPATGERKVGQYTWIDEGKGMMNLPAAFNKLVELRDHALPSEVQAGGQNVELDYQVVVSTVGPNGIKYDGSQAFDQTGAGALAPKWGTGLYLDYYAKDTLREVNILRAVPEKLAASPVGGELTRLLETSADEFVLKTTFYGSDKAWLKAGTLAQLDCWASETHNPVIIGRGVDIKVKPDGTGELNPFKASVLNVCINRQVIREQLAPGDHGALISAYRVVDGNVAVIPSFVVPVALNVPHQTLMGSTAYEVNRSIKSFGINRNYVAVPKGARLVRVTLEVPSFKEGVEGCQGVELMALEGANTGAPKETRPQLRVQNCKLDGTPSDEKRQLVLTRTEPLAGIWDLHIFGQYQFKQSNYKLRVDYVVAQASIPKIEGGLAALNGQFNWTVDQSSMSVSLSSADSGLDLSGLENTSPSQVAKGGHVFVVSPLGALRKYPDGTKSVTITTGGATGNDIDLGVFECPGTVTDPEDPACKMVGASTGSTDVESVKITPVAGKLYAVRVDGFEIKDEGKFFSKETLGFGTESGTVTIAGDQPVFNVTHAFSAEALEKSYLVKSPLFTEGKYRIVGALNLRTKAKLLLDAVPVSIGIENAKRAE